MERAFAGGSPDGNHSEGSRRAPAILHDLRGEPERAPWAQGASGRAAAAGRAEIGAIGGFPRARACRGRCRKRRKAPASAASVGAGRSDGHGSCGNPWGSVVLEDGADGSGERTRGGSKAGGMASAHGCSAGEYGAGDSEEDAETRRGA